MAIALILIIIGLARPTESAQALIGFGFLFLLSFVVLGNNLEYQIGEQKIITYSYDNITLSNTTETNTFLYTAYDDTTGIFNTHRFGYFLAIASVIGFTGVLVSTKWRFE